MKIIILGGTGLLGYHSTLSLLSKGHEITIVSRGSINSNNFFPKKVSSIVNNVFEMSRDELINLFTGFDALVYAIGPDEREIPPSPSADFFKENLVDRCINICSCAKIAKLKSIIILSSYFNYFHRKHPLWRLAKKHPYIRNRVKQAEECLKLSNSELKIIILEIPYVFGVMPNRKSLWADLLVPRLNALKPFIFYTTGGTAMSTAKYVGEAVRGVVEKGKTGTYIVGEQNMDWNEMLAIVTNSLGGFKKRITIVPVFIAQFYAYIEKLANSIKGREAGLNYPKYIKDFQCKFTYFPEEEMQSIAQDLELCRGDIKQTIKETFDECR